MYDRLPRSGRSTLTASHIESLCHSIGIGLPVGIASGGPSPRFQRSSGFGSRQPRI